jgi:hypothetical protein
MHEPLSQKLQQVVAANTDAEGTTLNQLLERTEGRGFYLVIILLALPFIVPVSLWGLSTVLGLAIAWLGLRLALGHRDPRLPRFMGDRRLRPETQRALVNGSVKVLRFFERLARPRRTLWMTTRPARFANALLMALMGLLLALPYPPLPPFTNSLPCYSIILIALSMMEEDGLLIWIAYVVSVGTAIYLGLIAGVLVKVFLKIWHTVGHWLAA